MIGVNTLKSLLFFFTLLHRFVGLLSGEKIQQFLIRAVLGSGDRVQPDELGKDDFESITMSVSLIAGSMLINCVTISSSENNFPGMASIDSRKMAKIYYLLENLFQTCDIFKTNHQGNWLIHEGVKVGLQFRQNADKNITVFDTVLRRLIIHSAFQ